MTPGFTFSLHPEGGSWRAQGPRALWQKLPFTPAVPQRGWLSLVGEPILRVQRPWVQRPWPLSQQLQAQQDRHVDSGLMGAGSREKALEGALGWMGLTSQDWTGTPHLS